MVFKTLLAAVLIFCLGFAAPAFAIDSYPGSTWGELLWQVPAQGPQPNIPNLTWQGWIRQGAEVARWDSVRLVPYLTVRYWMDTRGLSWNNTVGPGVGLSLLTVPVKQSSVTFGVETVWDYYYREWGYSASRLTYTVNVYVDWYGWWDLKKK
jgi:hypothetical protein